MFYVVEKIGLNISIQENIYVVYVVGSLGKDSALNLVFDFFGGGVVVTLA